MVTSRGASHPVCTWDKYKTGQFTILCWNFLCVIFSYCLIFVQIVDNTELWGGSLLGILIFQNLGFNSGSLFISRALRWVDSKKLAGHLDRHMHRVVRVMRVEPPLHLCVHRAVRVMRADPPLHVCVHFCCRNCGEDRTLYTAFNLSNLLPSGNISQEVENAVNLTQVYVCINRMCLTHCSIEL